MKTIFTKLTVTLTMILLLATAATTMAQEGDVDFNTADWGWFLGAGLTFNGGLLPVGSRVDAFDPDNVHCGAWFVHTDGQFGAMNVYGDDPETPNIDEGATSGNMIRFELNGRPANVDAGEVAWASKVGHEISLSATGTIGLEATQMPQDELGAPDQTVRFYVGIKNIGDVHDFYNVEVTNSVTSFVTLPQESFTYNKAGQTAMVPFDILVPPWGDTTDIDHITFKVFSVLDPTAFVEGTVDLMMTTTDIGDNTDPMLPGEFSLAQNYPNPFNPSTTIAFDLPRRSAVQLEIINLLGKTIEARDLGTLSAGGHSIEFNADHLSSGMYFYRIITEFASQTKKMVLLK